MPVLHAAVPRTIARPHRTITLVVSVTLMLGACAKAGDRKAGDSTAAQPQARTSSAATMSLVDFKEPLSQYPVAELYAACTAMPLHRAGSSGDLQDLAQPPTYRLRLVPLTSDIDLPDGSWQASGRFVGVVENYGTAFNAQYNVNRATSASAPGVTCAWYGFEQGTQQLMLRLVGPDSIKSVAAMREGHDPPHTAPKAEWRTLAGLPVPTPGNPPNLVAEVAWYICDQTGCCK